MMTSKTAIHGWVRQLDNDRLEIFLKVERVPGQEDRKIRASGPADEMNELMDWFEEKTGLRIEAGDVHNWRRQRRGPRPMEGQTTLIMGDIPASVEA